MESKDYKRLVVNVALGLGFGTAIIASPVLAQNATVIDPNILDFANLSTMIANIAKIFPGVISLVVGIIPILFILAIVGLVMGIFGAIVGMLEGLMRSLLK